MDPWPCSIGRGSSIAVSCGVGHRDSSVPTLLWLQCRLAAVALIHPLAWGTPYAPGVALKSKKKFKNLKKNKALVKGKAK